MSFLKNLWYMAAWEDEFVDQRPVGRTIANQAIVMWRSSDGTPCALHDRCPHRFVPLHLGAVRDSQLTCGYHGLAFDGSGRCVANPHGGAPATPSVRSFPCMIRHEIFWVWIGEPECADPELVPDLGFIEHAPKHAISRGYMPTAAAHQLLSDNILDLSHADYLHPDTLGGGSISRSRPEVTRGNNNTLNVRWTALNEEPLPIMRHDLSCERADMWTDVLWHPNGVMILSIVATPAGEPPENGIRTTNAHIMTPEKSDTTHYFYCNTRNFRTDDEEYNRRRATALRQAFELEDKPMVEAQQRRVGNHDFLELRPALLPVDAGSVSARRLYAKLLQEAERSL